MNKTFKQFVKDYYFAYEACIFIGENFNRKSVTDKNGDILEGISDQLYYEIGYINE
jgi:hypothetical protein